MKPADLHATANTLPPRTRARMVEVLNQALADLSDLASQAKHAHWNVRGQQFFALHRLYDELAALAAAHLDELAERATALGGTACGTVRLAAAASTLPEWPARLEGEDQFTQALTERFAAAANAVRAAIDTATQFGDAATADLLTEISRGLDKGLWLLEASA
jgi:starvation-inducible DNA-binding protein